MTLPKTDVVGNRYGMLVVKEITKPKNSKSRCIADCDCGNQVEVNIANLKSGNTVTCGCSHNGMSHRNIDITGNRYGRLVVVSRATSTKNRTRWFCQCDCGGTCLSTGKTLRQGKKKSCGCIKREQSREHVKVLHENRTLPAGEGARNHLMSIYRLGANRRGFEFSLTVEEFTKLTSGNCHYCGDAPSKSHKGVTCSTVYIYNGIDRVESGVGYVAPNCVSCCTMCNRMKLTHSKSDFIEKCTVIAERHNNYKRSAEMTDSL